MKEKGGRFKLAFVPFYPALGESEKNLDKIGDLAAEIQQKERPDVMVFPELASSGYLLENLAHSSALEMEGLLEGLPKSLVEASHGVEFHIGLLLREGGRVYNGAVVLHNGEIVHLHKKLYLPTYGLFDEKRYYVPGDTLRSYQGVLGKSGVLICEDAFHPAIAYALYAQGVEHVFVLSASPARGVEVVKKEDGRPEDGAASYLSWRKRLEIYAESFGQCYYYINRSGCEDGVYFDGRALAAAPNRPSLEFGGEASPYYIANLDTRDIASAHARGGPFVNENWNLNLRCIEEAHNLREKE